MSTLTWVKERLEKHTNLKSVQLLSPSNINITRKEGEDLSVYVISEKNLEEEIIEIILENHKPDFILNIPKDAYVKGDVYQLLDGKKIGFGGLGDLYRVLAQKENWPYTNPDISFVRKIFAQHPASTGVLQLDNRRYLVARNHLSPLTFITNYDYEFGAASVRSSLDYGKPFDAIIIANPNAQVSNKALEVASELNVKLLRWKEVMIQLGKKWE